MDEECNNDINDELFYDLGLDRVWHDDRGWIPDTFRYPPEQPRPLTWYEYCYLYNIIWRYPRSLPNWAIESMDQYYRDSYYGNLTEENS